MLSTLRAVTWQTPGDAKEDAPTEGTRRLFGAVWILFLMCSVIAVPIGIVSAKVARVGGLCHEPGSSCGSAVQSSTAGSYDSSGFELGN